MFAYVSLKGFAVKQVHHSQVFCGLAGFTKPKTQALVKSGHHQLTHGNACSEACITQSELMLMPEVDVALQLLIQQIIGNV